MLVTFESIKCFWICLLCTIVTKMLICFYSSRVSSCTDVDFCRCAVHFLLPRSKVNQMAGSRAESGWCQINKFIVSLRPLLNDTQPSHLSSISLFISSSKVHTPGDCPPHPSSTMSCLLKHQISVGQSHSPLFPLPTFSHTDILKQNTT